MLNNCQFIGNLGADPETRKTQNGDSVTNLRMAVTEKWKDKNGDAKESTEWVSVVLWGALADIAGKYLRKGSKAFISGKMKTRKWVDQSGADRYSTEIVLQGFDTKLVLLDGPKRDDDRDEPRQQKQGRGDDMSDEIPFSPEWRA